MRLNGKKQFALFITCFGWGKNVADKNVIDTLGGALDANSQRMLNNHYSCFGGAWGLLSGGTQMQKSWMQQRNGLESPDPNGLKTCSDGRGILSPSY